MSSSSIQLQDISNSMSVQQMEEPESRGRFHIQLQQVFKIDSVPIQFKETNSTVSHLAEITLAAYAETLLWILLPFLYDRAILFIFNQAVYCFKEDCLEGSSILVQLYQLGPDPHAAFEHENPPPR